MQENNLASEYPLLEQIDSPSDLRKLSMEQLPTLCSELRRFLLHSLDETGGHFGSNLGVVELTVALHYAFNTPDDRLVWDVGHQCYPHKILTGRRQQMAGLRQAAGIAGFPKRSESEHDTFGVGHSSTSISAALGMSVAAKAQGLTRRVAAIIGDGALTAGMAFEALNHAGHLKADMMVVLNDNDMSISENVGGLNSYLARLLNSTLYSSVREGGKKVLEVAPPIRELVKRTEEHMKGMLTPGTLFEELGFYYVGPVDGHDVIELVKHIKQLEKRHGPSFLHIVTKKGKGFQPAEKNPTKYHAVSPGYLTQSTVAVEPVKKSPAKKSFSNIFGDWLCDMAEQEPQLFAVTPAMCEGSGMVEFSQKFSDRYIDVAIAEQHAVTLAAGMACDGLKPVVAIYSTFLQRGYDQLVHDVALQNLDVLFAIDRAGLVGADGPTHAGAYDVSFMRCIPKMVIMCPSNEDQCRKMLSTGYHYPGPAAVRYPRGSGSGITVDLALNTLEVGKGHICRQHSAAANQKIAILAFGPLLHQALIVAENLDATVVDMRFAKPLDSQLLAEVATDHQLIVTLEDSCIAGGAGSAVNETLQQLKLLKPVLNLGLPDRFIDQGNQQKLYADLGLDAKGIEQSIRDYLG
ncbi:1-deoxy-D-xylulose-5-phosphate synthase [Pelagibaculum spongiae]|uniref:1-deoxy-D-xylulose-5-phosphate synthase n=1 Tax=Pelagibaculum spongiae TaxID=2080658 RepID=A0A2V1H0L1_9GAMM|nr:1-deoxy-D-xylulose-5-phosphate synthase [Pelagibaculum spongiae]PVZ71500.1 1-deoxy-D-xylulose-5-phosphate synthase [Pelagibaculum spongiae]